MVHVTLCSKDNFLLNQDMSEDIIQAHSQTEVMTAGLQHHICFLSLFYYSTRADIAKMHVFYWSWFDPSDQ